MANLPPVTRRGVLAGAIALPWLVACGTGTGTDVDVGVEAPASVDVADGTFSSRFWPGQSVRWRLARPKPRVGDTASQPLVVALHGQGGDADWPFDGLHMERHVASTGLAVATVDGGSSYWHARRSGIDTGTMVVEEFLPLLRAKGLATDRIGLIGWSMGGYGALLLATRLGPGRVAGVVAASSALWLELPSDPWTGAFDDQGDFARNDVFAKRALLRGIPVRLDCGTADYFIEANRAFARGLPDATVTFDDGGHTEDYWIAHAKTQMTWLADHLR